MVKEITKNTKNERLSSILRKYSKEELEALIKDYLIDLFESLGIEVIERKPSKEEVKSCIVDYVIVTRLKDIRTKSLEEYVDGFLRYSSKIFKVSKMVMDNIMKEYGFDLKKLFSMSNIYHKKIEDLSDEDLLELYKYYTRDELARIFRVSTSKVRRVIYKRKMRKPYKGPTREELIKLTKNLSNKEIAERHKIHPKTLEYLIYTKYKIRRKTKPPRDVIIQRIKEGKSVKEIAEEFGYRFNGMRDILYRYGIKRREILYPAPSREELVQDLKTMNIKELAEKYGYKYHGMRKRVYRLGIKLREIEKES